MSEPKEKPGSAKAVARGCTCDPLANNDGRGFEEPGLGVVFYPDLDCPAHGLNKAMNAVKAEEAIWLRVRKASICGKRRESEES